MTSASYLECTTNLEPVSGKLAVESSGDKKHFAIVKRETKNDMCGARKHKSKINENVKRLSADSNFQGYKSEVRDVT